MVCMDCFGGRVSSLLLFAKINPNRKQKHSRQSRQKVSGNKERKVVIKPEKENESHRKFWKREQDK